MLHPDPSLVFGVSGALSEALMTGGPAVHSHCFLAARLGEVLSLHSSDEAEAAAIELLRVAPSRRRHALEELLHGALHEGLPMRTGGETLLARVARLLSRLDATERGRVVAGCAHKSEATRWDELFGACGAPAELLRGCLTGGDPRAAALLVLPTLHLEGRECCDAVLEEVRRAAQAHERGEVLAQLERFKARLLEDAPPS